MKSVNDSSDDLEVESLSFQDVQSPFRDSQYFPEHVRTKSLILWHLESRVVVAFECFERSCGFDNPLRVSAFCPGLSIFSGTCPYKEFDLVSPECNLVAFECFER